jgi:5-methylcytosine-specific restriction enzyme A
MAKPPYNSAAWLAVRLKVLERDGWECQLRYRGCQGRANAADHRLSVIDLDPHDPALLDEANLQAACTECNTRKRNAEARRRRPQPRATNLRRGREQRRVSRNWTDPKR